MSKLPALISLTRATRLVQARAESPLAELSCVIKSVDAWWSPLLGTLNKATALIDMGAAVQVIPRRYMVAELRNCQVSSIPRFSRNALHRSVDQHESNNISAKSPPLLSVSLHCRNCSRSASVG
jgi:hypothetical protein